MEATGDSVSDGDHERVEDIELTVVIVCVIVSTRLVVEESVCPGENVTRPVVLRVVEELPVILVLKEAVLLDDTDFDVVGVIGPVSEIRGDDECVEEVVLVFDNDADRVSV